MAGRPLTRRQLLSRVSKALAAADPAHCLSIMREVELRCRAPGGEKACRICGRTGAFTRAHAELCARCVANARAILADLRAARPRPTAEAVLVSAIAALRSSRWPGTEEAVADLAESFAEAARLDWNVSECLVCTQPFPAGRGLQAAGASLCEHCVESLSPLQHAVEDDPFLEAPVTVWDAQSLTVEALVRAYPDREMLVLAALGDAIRASTAEEPDGNRCVFCGVQDADTDGLLFGGLQDFGMDLMGYEPPRAPYWRASFMFERLVQLCTVCLRLALAGVAFQTRKKRKRSPQMPSPEMVQVDAVRAVQALVVHGSEKVVHQIGRWYSAGPVAPPAGCILCNSDRVRGKGLVGTARISLCGRCLQRAQETLDQGA